MSDYVLQVAERIKGLRLILDITPEEMAEITGVSLTEYLDCEEGRSDFSFTFLYKCAVRFGIDLAELVTGDVPKLSFYTVVRRGQGMPIERRKGF
jgi:transcriptional regulator with XRE-family HTH domain